MQLKDWVEQNQNTFFGRDLHFLLRNVLPYPENYLLPKGYVLKKEELRRIERIKRKYLQGVPLAYLLAKEEFFGYTFKVNKHTLIPRPSTEFIVERAISLIKRERLSRVLDLGCGCANIAISIVKECPQVFMVASEISKEALKVSKENARQLKVRVHFVNSDLLSAFKPASFELIVSNPPYVESNYLRKSKELCFEPKIALDGKSDGLYFLRRIILSSRRYLTKPGYLLLEVGINQRERIDSFLKKVDNYCKKEWFRDYQRVWRGLLLKK